MTQATLASVRDLPPIWGLTVKQDYIIDTLIPRASLVMISGESGSGKSTLTLALADAVANGEPFIGYNTQKTPVLIVDRENGLYIYHERLQRLNVKPNPDLMIWGHWNDWEPGGPSEKAILQFVQKEQGLVIFDSFVAFHEGSEQDADDVRNYMDMYRRITGIGGTVILIHHTGKGENTKEYRGSSDIKASLDVGLTLTQKGKYLKHLVLRPFKSREGIMDTMQLTFEGEKFLMVESEFIPTTDPIWQAVIDVVRDNPGINQSQVIKLLPALPYQKIRKILLAGSGNTFHTERGPKNATFYSLADQRQPENPVLVF